MKTLTLCGSMRFSNEMQEIALSLEIYHGFNVLQCTYNPEEIAISTTEKQPIVDAHNKKIDLSDAIYVVDIDGYIGQSVKEEINYAKQQGKEIIYHSQFSNADTTGDKQEV